MVVCDGPSWWKVLSDAAVPQPGILNPGRVATDCREPDVCRYCTLAILCRQERSCSFCYSLVGIDFWMAVQPEVTNVTNALAHGRNMLCDHSI